jgi:hypothetical protein
MKQGMRKGKVDDCSCVTKVVLYGLFTDSTVQKHLRLTWGPPYVYFLLLTHFQSMYGIRDAMD